jgi:hypothetical protein
VIKDFLPIAASLFRAAGAVSNLPEPREIHNMTSRALAKKYRIETSDLTGLIMRSYRRAAPPPFSTLSNPNLSEAKSAIGAVFKRLR